MYFLYFKTSGSPPCLNPGVWEAGQVQPLGRRESWGARALSLVHLSQASQEVSVLCLSAYDCDFFNKGKLSLESRGIAICALVPQLSPPEALLALSDVGQEDSVRQRGP